MKLPRTKHIQGSRIKDNESDPNSVSITDIIDKPLVIEEKVDGSSLSISFDDNLDLSVYSRNKKATHKEFDKVYEWAAKYQTILWNILSDKYIMYGEWMFQKHSIFYDDLPHFFLESDIYDKEKNQFLCSKSRQELLKDSFITSVKVLQVGNISKLSDITCLLGRSNYKSVNWRINLEKNCNIFNYNYAKALAETDRSSDMEGLYIKWEENGQVMGRYKFIRYEFIKTIFDSKTHIWERELLGNSLSEGINFYEL